MPCGEIQHCETYKDVEDMERELLKVTRVACELWGILNRGWDHSRPPTWGSLSLSTQKWVREHEEVDRPRKQT